jgi:hypothetical protein
MMNDIYAEMRKPMTTFWDLTVDKRRALLVSDQQYQVDTPLRSLARMWADCEEDEVLMRLKYADEIEAVYSQPFITAIQGILVTQTAQRILRDMMPKPECLVINAIQSQR